MMKTVMKRAMRAAALVFMIIVSVPALQAFAEEPVRVLVMDEGFKLLPASDERLRELERLDGRLVLGRSGYEGGITLYKGEGGMYVVNELPLEEYVAGVVKAETGSDWAEEALKAQAVLVRTYVIRQRGKRLREEYDLTSSVLHQVYRGKVTDKAIMNAVEQTAGEILTWSGKPIEALYHSTTDGLTEVPEEVFGSPVPYLTSVRASGRLSPMALWSRRVTLKELAAVLKVKEISSIAVVSFTATGRAKHLAYVSDKGPGFIEARELRRLLGWKLLPSTQFSLDMRDGSALIEGKGFGHGVGMSQWSALEMAIKGKKYTEILAYFYPGAKLSENVSY